MNWCEIIGRSAKSPGREVRPMKYIPKIMLILLIIVVLFMEFAIKAN